MTTTLPRLPAKFRGLANNILIASGRRSNQRQNYAYKAPQQNANIQSPHSQSSMSYQPKSQISINSQTNPQVERSKSNLNTQLQEIREAALKKYDEYSSKIKQIDKNFNTEIKKANQQTNRNLSKFADTISVLSSDISQVNNQSQLLQNKIEALKKKQNEMQTSGLDNLLQPFKNNFNDFEKEFEDALENIKTLFSKLSIKVKMTLKEYDSIKFMNNDVEILNDSIEKLSKSLNYNSDHLLSVHFELENAIFEQRKSIHEKYQEKIKELSSQVDKIEHNSIQSLSKSQDVVADTQTSQFEMKEMFDASLNNINISFKSKLEDSKRAILDLQQSRFELIDLVHSRLSKTTDSIARIRRKKVKQASSSKVPRESLQPMIDELREKVERLEKKLKDKIMEKKFEYKRSTSNKVKLFYNVKEDGSVKIIMVDETGYVIC